MPEECRRRALVGWVTVHFMLFANVALASPRPHAAASPCAGVYMDLLSAIHCCCFAAAAQHLLLLLFDSSYTPAKPF